MATQGLVDTENVDKLQAIMDHIKNGDNFLLSGGAGSGKTYTLVEVIKKVIEENPTSKIACMTYTNAAVREIEERVNNNNLNVSTIHDFLWDNIKHFQQELKFSLIKLANDADVTKIRIVGLDPVPGDFFESLEDGIQYKEYLSIKDGIVSHDEVLILANHMFSKHRKLCDILKDKFKFILVDEYQDTQKEVVEILLVHLKQSDRKNIIGFFGDAMQSIYDDGIGDLKSYVEEGLLKEVKKEQNRRNPRLVYELANKLRTDGIVQRPSSDLKAPNMMDDGTVREGAIRFLYSQDCNLDRVKECLGWDFGDLEETKELNLTHSLIAEKAGFGTLMDVYAKDRILAYRDRIKKYIKDNSIDDDFSKETFGEVIDILSSRIMGKELKKLQPARGVMQDFIDIHPELLEEARQYNYLEFLKIYLKANQLTDDKKANALRDHLFKIQNNIWLYKNGHINDFLKATDFNIKSIQDKKTLKETIERLIDVGEKTIEDVIIDADSKGICKIDDKLTYFQSEKKYIYDRVKSVNFKELQNLYLYLEGHTPFSTQHKTKGAEFNNVLVILDNGKWNNYNFKNLFLDTGTPSVLERTQKIFYVCCTRTKENLAVFFNTPSNQIIEQAKNWFGESNVIDLDKLETAESKD